jgi:hypothetical protein
MCLHPSVVTILAVVTGVVKQRVVIIVISWDKVGGVIVRDNLRGKKVMLYVEESTSGRRINVALLTNVFKKTEPTVCTNRLQVRRRNVTTNIVSDACMMMGLNLVV